MADDLYTELLDVPPGARPPNHYALLGLDRFESDPAAIHTAVLRQASKLRRWDIDPDDERQARVQEMLNEVHRAAAVLENPQAKEDYDRRLAEQLGVPPPTARPQPPPQEPGPAEPELEAPAPQESPRRAAPLPKPLFRLEPQQPPRPPEGHAEPPPSVPPVKPGPPASTPPSRLCPRCSAAVRPGVTFCPVCGQNLLPRAERPPAGAPPEKPEPEARQPRPRERPPLRERLASVVAFVRASPRAWGVLAAGGLGLGILIAVIAGNGGGGHPARGTSGPALDDFSVAPGLTVDLPGGVKMEFVEVSPGRFRMGDARGREDERPVHTVSLPRPVYLSRTEVTQEQWQAVMGSNPSHFRGPNLPVEQVSWTDCQAFLDRLSRRVPGRTFRLPTEAEWEYACRAGSPGSYSFGDDPARLGEHAWFAGNADGATHPVAQKRPNDWGLCDMHGNVWEWCQDWYGAYSGGRQTNPRGPSQGEKRVLRGGAWSYHAEGCRCAFRRAVSPETRSKFFGFRVAHVPGETAPAEPPSPPPADSAELQAARQAWTDAVLAADNALLAEHASDEWTRAQTMAQAARRRQSAGQLAAATRLFQGAVRTLKQAQAKADAQARDDLLRRAYAALNRRDRLAAERALDELQQRWPNLAALTKLRQRVNALPRQVRGLRVQLGEGVELSLVLISPGTFQMGDARVPDERPVRQVTLTKGFYIGTHEVSREQWRAVMGAVPAGPGGDTHPVVNVSWHACRAFLSKLNQRVRGAAFRLPTEAEWEYACRAGSAASFCFGDDVATLGEYAWFKDNADGRPRPVGQKRANAWGLHDMHGNVWEWCSDWYAAPFPEGPQTDPTGAARGPGRAIRGGAFDRGALYCRSACRMGCRAAATEASVGFRVVLPEAPPGLRPAAPARPDGPRAPQPTDDPES
jgi:formylglycine-generating enzyme required for sulfatase activity